jgi:hypothetical protein
MATSDNAVPPHKPAALILRSEMNVRRSRELVAAAAAVVQAVRRARRPTFAGGSDSLESVPPRIADPRVIRTWAKVKAGALPTHGARRRWVAPGRGERCDGCGDPIGPDETELEIDFRNALLLRFHVACFKTWESFDRNPR